MHLMYYMDDDGKRVYTLKVSLHLVRLLTQTVIDCCRNCPLPLGSPPPLPTQVAPQYLVCVCVVLLLVVCECMCLCVRLVCVTLCM